MAIGASRRSVIAAAAAAALEGGQPVAAATSRGLDLKDPKDFHTAIVKMRGSFGSEMVMGYVKGRYYGYSEGRMTPFYGLLAGSFTRHRVLPDGDVKGVTFELAYFTDWDTGELLDAWRNPYTGKTVKVSPFRTEPSTFVITRDARIVFNSVPTWAKNSDRLLQPVVAGDDVWITEENRNEFPAADPAQSFFYSELVTMHALKSELDNPALKRVPTTVSFQSEVSWRPWLEMGNTPGHLVGNAAGRKIAHLEEFPAPYLAWSRKHHPDVFVNLEAFLDKGWS